ncbi:hypothetical protein [Nonomuraea sp. NPDC050643]|uniref:hypothetical protein n=1 Tax=Nonomuraea sp. NPDC050643 TaxID=3155660 RepID=UPI003401FC72
MHLRHGLITCCANAFVGLVLPFVALMGVMTLTEDVFRVPEPVGNGLLVVVGPAMLYLSVRDFRLAIVCTPATITVRGWVRGRTIPIEDVIGAGGLTSDTLEWLDATGRLRTSPVIAFVSLARVFNHLRDHNDQTGQRLQDWLDQHQPPSAKRRNAGATVRGRPTRTRFLWLGRSFGWVTIGVGLIFAWLMVQGMPPEIRAAQGVGTPGAFTASDVECGEVTCHWNGSFRSQNGMMTKADTWFGFRQLKAAPRERLGRLARKR